MVYRLNGTMKDGRLVLEPPLHLPAGERVASLAMHSTEPELIPLSTPFWKMDFPKGVYKREHEEPYYLNRILVRQHVAFLMESHAVDSNITSQYQDPFEAAHVAALGDSSYWDDHLTASELTGFPNNTIESAANGLLSSEYAQRSAMGTSLNAVLEAAAGLTTRYTSLLDEDVRESLKDQHDSIREAITPKYVETSEPESKLPPVDLLPFKYIDEQNARLRNEQRERDERQKKQAENSDALLKLHAEQIEENRKLQKEQRRDSRFAKIIAVAALIVSIVSAVLTALGVFN